MSGFIVCPACQGNGKRPTKAGKDWFACEMCTGQRVIPGDPTDVEVDLELAQATLTRLHESIRQHQRALIDLLADVSLALVDTDEMLHDRVQAFMDIEPNDENFEIVSPEILDLIERAATATALSDQALAEAEERLLDRWLCEMRRLLP